VSKTRGQLDDLRMQIKINYKPREWAKAFHESDKKLFVLVLHRRAGKTTAAINHLIRECFRNPESEQRYAYIAPTYKQAKTVAWDILRYYARQVPKTKFNEAELRCDFPNGSRITLFGADNPDSLRGIGLWGVVFDEYSQQPSNIYSEIILPTLAEHDGFSIWIGTPKGKNDFYRIYSQFGVDDEKWQVMSEEERKEVESHWFRLKLSIDDTHLLKNTYLERAKMKMTEDEFNQEFNCSFEGSLKGAYYADELRTAYQEHRIKAVPHEPLLNVTTAWDLGMRDSTAIGFFQISGSEIRMIDYYENTGHGLDHYIGIVRLKPYLYDRHIAPHDIEVKELGSGRSRIESAELLGIDFDTAPKLSIQEGINAVRMIFPRLYIDEFKCEDFLRKLSQYTKEWDDKGGKWKDKPKHDFTCHCFTGDTKLLTSSGTYPIMELSDNHLILTPKGWKKFKNLGITKKNAPLVEVKFKDNTQVRCTPEHLFLTDKGWKSAKFLRRGLKIQSSLTASRVILMVGYTVYSLMKDTFQEVVQNFTEEFGNMLLVKYLKDATYIIKTGIQKIMNWKISNVSMAENTIAMNGKIFTLLEPLRTRREIEQGNGINLKKEDCGIAEWQKECKVGKIGKQKKEIVYSARKNLKVLLELGDILKNFVIQIAKPLTIEGVKKLDYKEDVWDLSVPEENCFSLSNGAVVHNSADMLRYFATSADIESNQEELVDQITQY
jgi:phage terminase large subunit